MKKSPEVVYSYKLQSEPLTLQMDKAVLFKSLTVFGVIQLPEINSIVAVVAVQSTIPSIIVLGLVNDISPTICYPELFHNSAF